MPTNAKAKKLTGGLVLIAVLAVCLCFTTAALVWQGLALENHRFATGRLHINLNDGRPIIQEQEFLFEPGMTVEKQCFIRNDGTADVYYKLYFDQVAGGLAEVLEITVESGGKTLYHGTVAQLNRQAVAAADDVLKAQETRYFTVRFYFPTAQSNRAQNASLSFALCAEATQVKNNPHRLFV